MNLPTPLPHFPTADPEWGTQWGTPEQPGRPISALVSPLPHKILGVDTYTRARARTRRHLLHRVRRDARLHHRLLSHDSPYRGRSGNVGSAARQPRHQAENRFPTPFPTRIREWGSGEPLRLLTGDSMRTAKCRVSIGIVAVHPEPFGTSRESREWR